MSNDSSTLGVAHTISSVIRARADDFLNNDRLRPDILLGAAKSIMRDGFESVSSYITHVTLGAAPLEEPVVLQPHFSNSHQAMAPDVMPAVAQGPNLLLNNNSSLTLTPADLGESDRPAPGGETAIRSQRTRMWIALIVGVSSLIVVPGLVVGVVTGQLPWGIALCGAIATIVSFIASLYYHHNPVGG